jgi:Flp pilus assembly pilin Flp
MFRRLVLRLRAWMHWPVESGQTTAEYALVILGAVAVATLLITWATGSHAISKLFDTVISKVLPG